LIGRSVGRTTSVTDYTAQVSGTTPNTLRGTGCTVFLTCDFSLGRLKQQFVIQFKNRVASFQTYVTSYSPVNTTIKTDIISTELFFFFLLNGNNRAGCDNTVLHARTLRPKVTHADEQPNTRPKYLLQEQLHHTIL